MRIESFTTYCPECGELITVEEYEMFVYDEQLYISFECPECNVDINNEQVYL